MLNACCPLILLMNKSNTLLDCSHAILADYGISMCHCQASGSHKSCNIVPLQYREGKGLPFALGVNDASV